MMSYICMTSSVPRVPYFNFRKLVNLDGNQEMIKRTIDLIIIS